MLAFSDGRFNCVVILDAIPDGERNTARILKDTLQDISDYKYQPLRVKYLRLNSIQDLIDGLDTINQEIKISGLLPWLHFEGHGYVNESNVVDDTKDGIKLADQYRCSWLQLKKLITPLNISTNLNLMLTLASCFGGAFASTIDPTDRAPVLGLIGPQKEILVGEIQTDFTAFYKEFFNSFSLRNALDALCKNTPKGLYFTISAKDYFYRVWSMYTIQLCTDEAMESRAKDLYCKSKATMGIKTPTIKEWIYQLHKDNHVVFDKYRDVYFMYDLFPENNNRFNVSHDEAEVYIANMRDAK